MLSAGHVRANLLIKLGELTGRTHALPLVLFAPTARCNSRCISCEWWKADGAGDLALAEIESMADTLLRFGTRVVVLTGGEPLFRPDILEVADLFLKRGMQLQLLTSGLALERFAPPIAKRFSEVTISLDGHTADLYRKIRGVNGLGAVAAGVAALRAIAPHLPIRARSTIHRENFRALPDLVAKAAELGVDQISFLAADVTSASFNRSPATSRPNDDPPGPRSLLLQEAETVEFGEVVELVIRVHERALAERRVVPGPQGLRRLVRYYRAHLGLEPFPDTDCNAPWTSMVIEADGDVRPCFFHPAVGNIRKRPLEEILSDAMPRFRRTLDVASNAVCKRCVCTLKVGLRSKLW